MAKYPYEKSCLRCDVIFVIKSAPYKNKKFCTHECSSLYKQVHHKEPNCLRCQAPLGRCQRKFCSKSCSAIVNNSLVIRPPKQPKPKRIKPQKIRTKFNGPASGFYKCQCKHCGLKFLSKRPIKYCEDHSNLYSHAGRARYWFTINVFKYPELFDLEQLQRVGFRSKDNPNGYTRDHKVSVNEAIRYNYDPYYITHVMNCELMLWEDNNRKNTRSSITYEKLVDLVDEYDHLRKTIERI